MKYLKSKSLVTDFCMRLFYSMICLFITGSVDARNFIPPLRLVSFNTKTVESTILLEWRTVGENNTDYFNIEQSTDGIEFKKVGSLKAAGTDPLNRYYYYTDPNPVAGNNYYRLSMYDLDGTIKYSATQVIKAEGTRRLHIAPNPVMNVSKFAISWNALAAGNASVIIYDQNGRPVFRGKLDVFGNAVVPVDNWPPGVYSVALDNRIRKEFSSLLVTK